MPATLCNFSVALTLFVTARDSSDAITLVSEKVWGEMSKPNADGTSINAMSEDITVEHLDGIVPPALRTLDGQPLDRASLTLGQVVEVQGVWDDDGFCEVVEIEVSDDDPDDDLTEEADYHNDRNRFADPNR